jgi:hypothetical protein
MGWARDHYHMASNFHGVLIFVIFVVDLQSRKFPPTKINAYPYIREAWPKTSASLLSLLSSSWWRLRHKYCSISCHLSKFLTKVAWWQGNRARSRACIDYIIVCAAPHPWTGLLSWYLKPQKLIQRAFSDFPRKVAPLKITHHMISTVNTAYRNYYGSMQEGMVRHPTKSESRLKGLIVNSSQSPGV